MIVDTTRARVTLAPGRISRLQLRAGTRLTGVAGTAWITLDDDARDILLEHRESWTLDRDARVLATALRSDGQAEIQVEDPQLALPQRSAVQALGVA